MRSCFILLVWEPEATSKEELFARLQDWGFFAENDTTRNPGFWETGFFTHDIIAENLERQQWLDERRFVDSIYQQFIQPLKYKGIQPAYDYMNNGPLVLFPADRSISIAPATRNTQLIYYVIIPGKNEIYQWTRLKQTLKPHLSAYDIVWGGMAKLAGWQYGTDMDGPLDNKEFWNTHVLLKQKGKYKYLKRLQ